MKEWKDISKRHIRKIVLTARDALTVQEQERAASLLTERICGHQWFYGSDTLLAFVSYGSEIDTSGIIREALRLGKKVYVPKVEGEQMCFYSIQNLEELVEGYKGIREPKGDTECFVYQPQYADKTFMLMPGAVFDWNRNRIGYGKGFYDRFLADKQALQLRTIGVCHRVQMVDELPSEPWDIKPYQVIDI